MKIENALNSYPCCYLKSDVRKPKTKNCVISHLVADLNPPSGSGRTSVSIGGGFFSISVSVCRKGSPFLLISAWDNEGFLWVSLNEVLNFPPNWDMSISFKFLEQNCGGNLPKQNDSWHLIVYLKQLHIIKLDIDVHNAQTYQAFFNRLQES